MSTQDTAGTAREGMTMDASETTRLRAKANAECHACGGSGVDCVDRACVCTGEWTMPKPAAIYREAAELRAALGAAEHKHATVLASLTHALARIDALSAEAKDMHDRMTDAEVRATVAERERDDLAATLETRTAEHALAMARVRELEAIIAGRTTPPTEADEVAAFRAGLRVIRLGARWHVYDADGRPCAWPTAEVSRG